MKKVSSLFPEEISKRTIELGKGGVAMNAVSLSRVTMGTVIMAGLFFYEPVAYVASGAMILSGLTGT